MKSGALLIALAAFVGAQDRGLVQPKTPSKLALVIGNSTYPNAPLVNPGNDADLINDTLGKLGFEVILVKDADLQRMHEVIDQFAARLSDGAFGFFYFAGHGVQLDGMNYLVPANFSGTSESDIRFQTFPAYQIQEKMQEHAGLHILVLDACRNNPYHFTRNPRGGLAGMTHDARGTLVAFSTGDNQIAEDGPPGENGLYVRFLSPALMTPGLEVRQIFQKAKVNVDIASEQRQTPAIYENVIGEYTFLSPQSASEAPSGDAAQAWTLIADSKDPKEFETFAHKYPLSDLAAVALSTASQLHRMQQKKSQSAQTTSSEPTVQVPKSGDSEPETMTPQVSVARLRCVTNSMVLQPNGSRDWIRPSANRPIAPGEGIWTDRNSRAELEMDIGSLSLSTSTLVKFLGLTDTTVQLQISAGAVKVHLEGQGRDKVFEVATPGVSIRLANPGNYRVEVSDTGATTISVFEGKAEGTTKEGKDITVAAAHEVRVAGEQLGAPTVARADPADRSCPSRVHSTQASSLIKLGILGAEELVAEGWLQSKWGMAWTPPGVSADWAPYRYGHWTWIEPWGWNWVDNAQWGFAPSHYGRWIKSENKWLWIPGTSSMSAVYAPALVAWSDGGGSDGKSIAWFPLGPDEAFQPVFQHNGDYVGRVNAGFKVPVFTPKLNRSETTRMAERDFVDSRDVNQVRQPLPSGFEQLLLRRIAPIAPNEKSLQDAGVALNRIRPSAAVEGRKVVALATAPPPLPDFLLRSELLNRHPGVPLRREELNVIVPGSLPSRTASSAQGLSATFSGGPLVIELKAKPPEITAGPGNRSDAPSTQPAPPKQARIVIGEPKSTTVVKTNRTDVGESNAGKPAERTDAHVDNHRRAPPVSGGSGVPKSAPPPQKSISSKVLKTAPPGVSAPATSKPGAPTKQPVLPKLPANTAAPTKSNP
jgi:hypothetical protein